MSKSYSGMLAKLVELQIPNLSVWESGVDQEGNMYFNVSDKQKYIQAVQNRTNVQTGVYKYHPYVNIYIPLIFLLALSFATPLSWFRRMILLFVNVLIFNLYLIVRFSYGLKSYLSTPGYNILPEYSAANYEYLRSSFLILDKLGLILVVIITAWGCQLLANSNRLDIIKNLTRN